MKTPYFPLINICMIKVENVGFIGLLIVVQCNGSTHNKRISIVLCQFYARFFISKLEKGKGGNLQKYFLEKGGGGISRWSKNKTRTYK